MAPGPEADTLLARAVEQALRARGLVWDAPLFAFARLGSTSDHLVELAQAGAREWTVVVAREQSQGRGRQGHTWLSPPGNLFLSTLLRPAPEVRAALVPLAAGLAVAATLGECGVQAQLKWPNDALVGERKIAGVLCDARSVGESLEHVVVGIGVNLDLDHEAPELGASATSVRGETGRAPELAPVAAALLLHLAECYRLLSLDPHGVVAAWRERAAPWWGEPVRVDAGPSQVRGRLRSIDDDGALHIETDDGRELRLLSGEVARLRPAPTS